LLFDDFPIRVSGAIDLDISTPAALLPVQRLNHRIYVFSFLQVDKAVILVVHVLRLGGRSRRNLLRHGAEVDAWGVLGEKGLNFLVVRRLWFDAWHVTDVETAAFGLRRCPMRLCVVAVPAVKCWTVISV